MPPLMSESSEQNTIVIYQQGDGSKDIRVRLQGESVWLTQAQIAELFDVTPQNITLHIKNVYGEGELVESVTCKDSLQVQKEGARDVERRLKIYNLDVIISVGYRINSAVATRFRQWATARLREYIVKGFAMDDERLKGTGGGDYWKELLDRIRDIRSSEKVLYRQVLDLYATSIDYNPKSAESVAFFKVVQNKLHYATSGQTAAEIIHGRADAEKDFMGLTAFAGAMPVKSEVAIAKNYLSKEEIFKLNRLVSAFFDLAEIKAEEHKAMRMADWVAELDKFAENFGQGMLDGPGQVSHEAAVAKAEAEYRKYQAKTLSPVEEAYLESIKDLQAKAEKKGKQSKG